MKKFILAVGMLASSLALAQNDYLELVRSDLKTEKKAIITEAMQFTEEESTVFWPIYREYEAELDKLADQRIAAIKDYAANYENMSDEKAKELTDTALKLQESRVKLKKKYFKKLSKVLSVTTAAKFIQVENQINLLTDLQVAAELPLVKKPSGGMDD